MNAQTNRPLTVTFQGKQYLLEFEKYQTNGNTAIVLIDPEQPEFPAAVATCNVMDFPIERELVGIKWWSENTGMVEALVEAGVIEPQTEFEIPSGFVTVPFHRLTRHVLDYLNHDN